MRLLPEIITFITFIYPWTQLACADINPTTGADTVIEEAELQKWLSAKCDGSLNVRPVLKYTQPLMIYAGMAAYSFRGIRDKEQIFSVLGEMTFTWQHPCLKWGDDVESKNWSHIEMVDRPATDLWVPIIVHSNAVDNVKFLDDQRDTSRILIRKTGLVTWKTQSLFNAFCNLELKTYPFDTQTCSFFMELYDDDTRVRFGLDVNNTYVDDGFVSPSEVWESIDPPIRGNVTSTKYAGVPSLLYSVKFIFTLRRLPTIFVMNTILPTFLLLLLVLFTVFMPPKLPDRPTVCLTVMLAMTILQSSIVDSVPQSSEIMYMATFVVSQNVICMVCTVYALVACQLARLKKFQYTVNLGCCGKFSFIRLVDIAVYGFIAVVTLIIDLTLLLLMVSQQKK